MFTSSLAFCVLWQCNHFEYLKLLAIVWKTCHCVGNSDITCAVGFWECVFHNEKSWKIFLFHLYFELGLLLLCSSRYLPHKIHSKCYCPCGLAMRYTVGRSIILCLLAHCHRNLKGLYVRYKNKYPFTQMHWKLMSWQKSAHINVYSSFIHNG